MVAEHLGPDVPLHFSAFHPDWKMLDVPPTPPQTLTRARRIALAGGLRYVYTGNVHDAAGQSTYCHGCGARADRPRLVRTHGVEYLPRRALRRMRHALRRGVRRRARTLGAAAPVDQRAGAVGVLIARVAPDGRLVPDIALGLSTWAAETSRSSFMGERVALLN